MTSAGNAKLVHITCSSLVAWNVIGATIWSYRLPNGPEIEPAELRTACVLMVVAMAFSNVFWLAIVLREQKRGHSGFRQ